MEIEQSTEGIVRLIKESANIYDKLTLRQAIDILNDNWIDYLDYELGRQFSKSARARLRPLITTEINVLKKVVTETSMVYKKPAKRHAIKADATEFEDYETMLDESSIDLVMSTAQRYTKAVGHVLLRPIVRAGKMEIDIILPDAFEVYVDPDDWKKIIAIQYVTGVDYGPTTSQNAVTLNTSRTYAHKYLWVAKDCIIDKKTYKVGIYEWEANRSEKDYVFTELPYLDNGNPFLPFVLTREEWPTEKLLCFSRRSDLVTSTIQVGVLLTMLNELKKFASYKQVYITGPTDLSEKISDKLLGGAGTLWKFFSDSGTASASILDSTADIKEFMDSIEKRVMIILAQYGIPPSAFTQSGSPISGYARKIERQALDEGRQADIPFWRWAERELFKAMKIVSNADKADIQIPLDATLSIDFDDLEFNPSPQEDQAYWSWAIATNLKTPVDYLMTKNPDLSKEEATKLFLDNKDLNRGKFLVEEIKNPSTPTITK